MTQDEKIQWMAVWAAKNNLKLELEGECGFGRECVGVTNGGNYPDYEWHNADYSESFGGGVWTPEDAYHKHPCVAVLGRGEGAEDQLYQWLKWFDDNGYVLEIGAAPVPPGGFDVISLMMGKHMYCRMVKGAKP